MADITKATHGDGRRMAENGHEHALREACQRRARMIRFFRSLESALDATDRLERRVHLHEHDRRWASGVCHVGIADGIGCFGESWDAEDVGLLDGVPVAMCKRCRIDRREGRDTR